MYKAIINENVVLWLCMGEKYMYNAITGQNVKYIAHDDTES